MGENMLALTEDIAKMCGELTLTESEASVAVMSRGLRQQGEEKLKLCLMVKFAANKQINGEVFKNTIPKIWKTTQDFEVETLNNNIFAFYFQNQADRKRVKAGGPWHFDNFLLVLEEPSLYGEISKMHFNMVEFWVHILKAPLCCMTRETSLFLGEQLGQVTNIDEKENNTSEGRIIRIRVEVDISKPLKRFLKVDLSGSGETRILMLKYERLPDFCYQCGMVGHGERECPSSGESCVKKVKQYGHWMRALSPTKNFGYWMKKEKYFSKETEDTSKEKNPHNSMASQSERSEEWGKKLKEAEQRKAKGKLEVRDEITKMEKAGKTVSPEESAPPVLEKSTPTKVLLYGKSLPSTQNEAT